MTEREAEVLPIIPVGLLFGIRICLSVQPNVGNVNQQKAALDLQEGIWIHLLESSGTPYSPNQNRFLVPLEPRSSRNGLFLTFSRSGRIRYCLVRPQNKVKYFVRKSVYGGVEGNC